MDGTDVSNATTPTAEEVQKLLTELMVGVNREHGTDFSSDGKVAVHKNESDLAANVGALEDILASCARQTQKAVARLNHRRNSLLPIHQLPPEILGRAIYLAIHFDLEPFSRRLWTLSTICKRWHEVIQSMPQFWSVLDCRTRPSTVQYVLGRSMNTPLFVNYDTRPRNQTVRWFLDAIRPHSARWESLYYCGSAHCLGEVAKVFDSPTPILADFYVYNTDFEQAKEGVAQPIFTLSEGRNLRDVHLRAAVLSYDSPRLASLRSLQLTWLSSPPSVAQLSEIILQSPRLDSLVLAHFFPTATAPAPSPAQPAFSILMSELQDLEILDVPRFYSFEFLARLEAPRCNRVRLGDRPKLSPSGTLITTNLLDSGILDPKYHAIRSTLRTTLISAKAIHITVFKDHTIIAADFVPEPDRQRRRTVIRGRGRGRGGGRGGHITTIFRDGWKAKPPPLLLTITPAQQKRTLDIIPALGELLESTGATAQQKRTLDIVPALGELLESIGATAPVILTIKADLKHTVKFPANTFSRFSTLKELNLDGIAAFRAAAKELGKPQGATAREAKWTCLKLSELHVRFGNEEKIKTDESALMIGWLRDRWSTPTTKTEMPSPLTQFHFVNHAPDPEARWKSAFARCRELIPEIAEGGLSYWGYSDCACGKF